MVFVLQLLQGYIGLMQKCCHSDPDERPTACYLKKELNTMSNTEWDNVIDFNMPTKIVKSSDIGPIKTDNLGVIYKSKPLGDVIKSALAGNLKSQSTTSESGN